MMKTKIIVKFTIEQGIGSESNTVTITTPNNNK